MDALVYHAHYAIHIFQPLGRFGYSMVHRGYQRPPVFQYPVHPPFFPTIYIPPFYFFSKYKQAVKI